MRKERKSIVVGIDAETISSNPGLDTESVSQYTFSSLQKINDFDPNARSCTGSVHAQNQPDSGRLAPFMVQTPRKHARNPFELGIIAHNLFGIRGME